MLEQINRVIIHGCFINFSGYAAHTREFATALNKLIPVRVRNFSYQKDLTHLTQEQKDMVIYQRFDDGVEVGKPYDGNIMGDEHTLSIVLLEHNHMWFYENYIGPKVAYCVWESTEMVQSFFARLLQFDQLWTPTKWQAEVAVKQGYPADRVKVVPEGVRGDIFFPAEKKSDRFTYLIAGRWDHRKSIKECVEAFLKADVDADLLISADNPFSVDGMNTTEERLKHYGFEDDRIKILHHPPTDKYIELLKQSHCFLSCSRAEGWNLPLIEAASCGVPCIYSKHPSQIYMGDTGYTVDFAEWKKPENVFNTPNTPGLWGEPDWDDLVAGIKYMYENYQKELDESLEYSKHIRTKYAWKQAAGEALNIITSLSTYSTEIVEPRGAQDAIKLNLGCGNDLKPGWINVDRSNGNADECWDIINMPCEDGYADEILISHVLEHFLIPEVPTVLHELNRVLKLGGKLEIRVPDMEQAVKAWQNADDKWQHMSYELFGTQDYPDNVHKCGFTQETLPNIVKAYGFKIISCNIEGNQLILLGTKVENDQIYTPTINNHWVDGAYVQFDDCWGKYYQVTFMDDVGNHIHSNIMTDGWWTRTNRKYYTPWRVKVSLGNELIFDFNMVLHHERVLIEMGSKSLGDTICWIPYVEEFRKKHECEMFCMTHWNKLFKKVYPHINFLEPGETYHNIYASYTIGCWEGDFDKNPHDWRTIPLQQIATDILGLDYKEVRPKIWAPSKGNTRIKDKYVCISEWSTLLRKHWLYENGWQTIVDYLNSVGYKVMVISTEPTNLKNIINRTNKSIYKSIDNIKHCDFYIGLGHGPAWVAWALNKPVIMISPFSDYCEFECNRILPPEGVCHGCFGDVTIPFDRGDWDNCPRNKNFECSKSITPARVIEEIEKVREGLNNELQG